MEPRPTEIALDDERRLLIGWSDGQRRRYTATELRERCPCATCREKRTEAAAPKKSAVLLPVLSLAEAQPTAIAGVSPVGNYAYSIAFNDGHDTGIFTLPFLRELGQVVEAEGA